MEIIIHDGKQDVMLSGGEKCFELSEQRTRGGKTIWEAVLWFVDLSAVFDYLLKRRIRNSDAKTLSELKETILKAQAELMSVWTLNKFDDLLPGKVRKEKRLMGGSRV